MQSLGNNDLVGFVELQVGSLAVQVPIRHAKQEERGNVALPLASFETEGDSYAILIRGEGNSHAVERAVREAAKQALVHLSRKLLN